MTTFLAKASEHAVELPFPAFFFGVIAMAVFLLLGWVTRLPISGATHWACWW